MIFTIISVEKIKEVRFYMLKKLAIFLLVFVMIFSLAGCAKRGHRKMIKQAIEEVKHSWQHTYSYLNNGNDGHFEIKNTRVITIKENTNKDFKDVSYVIEFEIYSDYFSTAPYYYSIDMHDQVIVYKDGKMEVPNKDVFKNSTMQSKESMEKVIASIDDYGDKYNYIENLEKTEHTHE